MQPTHLYILLTREKTVCVLLRLLNPVVQSDSLSLSLSLSVLLIYLIE